MVFLQKKFNSVYYFGILGIALIGLYFRFQCLAERPFGGDEAYQLEKSMGPLKPIWKHNNYGDFSAFPGEYLLNYPLVKVFGESQNKWGLALFHILITIWSFYCLKLISDRLFKSEAGGIVLFLIMAFHQVLIFHSLEFRPYGFLSVLSLTTFYFVDVFLKDGARLGKLQLTLLTLYFLFCILAHQYGILIFVFITMNGFLQEERFWVKLRKEMLYLALIFLIALPIWFWFSIGTAHQAKSIKLFKDTFEYIPNPMLDIVGFIKNVVGNLIGFKFFYVFLIGPAALFLKENKDRLNQLGFFMILIFLPLYLNLLSDVVMKYWFIQRQFTWVMPLFAIWVGWCCDSLWVSLRQNSLRRQNI